MKISRTSVFIAISSAALLMVLIIQVNWIFQTAKIKEDIFNERANMVLSKTATALAEDTVTCRKMETCVGPDELKKTDSLFTNYMQFYELKLDYSFAVKSNNSSSGTGKHASGNVYKKKLDEEAGKNGLELNLFLPQKKQFIVKEMGTMFITSVLLILIVLLLFWRTIHLLLKEKRISEHTTDFLNNMTHEFKTPLTNIALAGKMMIREPGIKQEDKIKHYSEIILQENEKLRLQVEQVLSMTALERGEIPLHKTEVDLHELIKEALRCISVQIDHQQGTIQLHLLAENAIVFGDKTHLTNALSNLIDNALKYSKDQPEILIETKNDQGTIRISIQDHGIGIEKEFIKKIFTKFFRVPTGDVHNVKGFGLGLAYIHKITELHGGTIDVSSEKEKGSTFTLTLPNV